MTEHPIKQILFIIGVGIALILIINLASFGLILELSAFIMGCVTNCTKTQLVGTIIIDILISIPVGLICVYLDHAHKKPYNKQPEGVKE